MSVWLRSSKNKGGCSRRWEDQKEFTPLSENSRETHLILSNLDSMREQNTLEEEYSRTTGTVESIWSAGDAVRAER